MDPTNYLRNYTREINEFENYNIDLVGEYLPYDLIDEEASKDTSDRSPEEKTIIALLKWIKSEFKWVNGQTCHQCKQECDQIVSGDQGNSEELKYGATNVEIWKCSKCNTTTRFPRYNDCVKILAEKRGRCGEWCIATTQLLRALGCDVRKVWNLEDHVWNEVWIESKQRWVHIDGCEAAFDTPLVYSDGWGKKMSYCFAGNIGGIQDVSSRYIRRPEMRLDEPKFDETQLKSTLNFVNDNMRKQLDPVEEVKWFLRDQAEQAELASYLPTKTENLPSRQSGSAEWVNSRGESG